MKNKSNLTLKSMRTPIIKIILTRNKGFKWVENGSIYFKGYHSFRDQINSIDQDKLFAYFSNVRDVSHFSNLIKDINGCYSIIVKENNKTYIAVDRVRSIPLFFSMQNNMFYVSDSLVAIKKITGINTINKWSSVEFQHTGYVSLSHTLFDQIYQLQAGECIVVDHAQNRISYNRYRYYNFLHKDLLNSDTKELYPLFEKSIDNIFRRLDQSTKGKTLIVPLSGGLDSRLILSNIHKIGRKDVLCFYYGRKDCKEGITSKAIAKKLSYDWINVEYTKQKWNNCFFDESFNKYLKFSGNASSLPHIQDFLAMSELHKRSILPKNSVFIPGHTGDFISGGHIPKMNDFDILNKDTLINCIIDKHYNLWLTKDNPSHSIMNRYISSKIRFAIKDHHINSKEELADNFENWEWKERQSKFIVNSCRVYEFFGYEWRLPLWDLEFLDFWSRIPMEMRENKKLYKKYLLNSNYENLFHDYNYKNFEQKNFRSLFKKTSLGKYLLRFYNRYHSYYYLNYIGMVKYNQLFLKYRYRYNINSIMIVHYLNTLKKSDV